MFSFIRRIFGKKSALYDAQKKVMVSADARARQILAEDAGAHPEILFFLARDKDPAVRHAVARNKETPVHASALLANDENIDVRLALAARLAELLPDLAQDKHSQLYAYAVQALGVLAQDEVLKIRKALSTALQDCADAPSNVVGQLARDIERAVSEPILRFCIALADDDLLDILSSHPEPWVISAIAGRPEVSMIVSRAVFDTQDTPANTVLIGNTGAQFDIETLQMIIDKAHDFPEWHGALAVRKELSLDLARRLSGFVSESVLEMLQKRTDYDEKTQIEIAALVGRRLAYGNVEGRKEPAAQKLQRYIDENKLGADVIHDAVVWQDHEFVILALAYLAKVHPGIAKKMLTSGAARPIIALSFRAGLPMRLAVVLQTDFAKLKPKEIIYAKGGTDYPLALSEIKWQLEFFGVISQK